VGISEDIGMITYGMFIGMVFQAQVVTCAVQPAEVAVEDCADALARSATDAVLEGAYPAWADRLGLVVLEDADLLFEEFQGAARMVVVKLHRELHDL
jgi:hypothetical protein